MSDSPTLRKIPSSPSATLVRPRDGSEPSSPSTSLTTGEVLNHRYEIKATLGTGSFATVYLAFDRKMQIDKALKVFGLRDGNERIIPDLEEEARNQIRINHPAIARLYEFDTLGEYLFLDMEYVPGENIVPLVEDRSLSVRDGLETALQIARGMQEAHHQGVLHCDLKPQNILRTPEGGVKISDFGIARQLGKTDRFPGSGTPDYMAPERFDDRPVDARSDIFSFGAILHQLLYHQLPFEVRDGIPRYVLRDRVLKSRQPWAAMVRRCLALEPDQRYASFDEIVTELETLLDAEKHREPRIRKFVRLLTLANYPRRTRREFWVTCLLLLAALILLYPALLRPHVKSSFTSAPPLRVHNLRVTADFKPLDPKSDHPQSGQRLRFYDDTGKLVFATSYRGENPLDIRLDHNRVEVNGHLAGRIVADRDDLPLEDNLRFVRTEIDLTAPDWGRQTQPGFAVALGDKVSPTTLSSLPPTTDFLALGGNPAIHDLSNLPPLVKLKALDLSKNTYFDPQKLRFQNNLTWVDFSGTGLSTIPEHLPPSLTHIGLADNQLSSMEALHQLPALITADVSHNPTLGDTVSEYHSPTAPVPHAEPATQDVASGGVDWEQARKLLPWVFGLLLLALAIQVVRLVRGSLSPVSPLPVPTPQRKPADSSDLPLRLAEIDRKIREKKLYSPESDNALLAARLLLDSFPQHREVRAKLREVTTAIGEKMRTHMAQREFEPAFLAARSALELVADPQLLKLQRSCRKHLVHDRPLRFVRIPAGSFEMGDFENGIQPSALPLHQVTLAPFELSTTVVTNRQFCDFLNAQGNQVENGVEWLKLNSQYALIEVKNGRFVPKEPYSSFPVIEVSWDGARRYCEWAGGRLPTEAEWEYAARSRGRKTAFASGNEADPKRMNYLVDANDDRWHSVAPVMNFKPNHLGLYEMSGNMLEWCSDWFDPNYYKTLPDTDPTGPDTGVLKVVRGGGWCYPAEHMKTYYRGSAKPLSRNNFISFRMARSGGRS